MPTAAPPWTAAQRRGVSDVHVHTLEVDDAAAEDVKAALPVEFFLTSIERHMHTLDASIMIPAYCSAQFPELRVGHPRFLTYVHVTQQYAVRQ